MKISLLSIFAGFLIILSCQRDSSKSRFTEIAINDEVAEQLSAFEGRGALTDGSEPIPAESVVSSFELASDLALDLVLSEPEIHQPLELSFDTRGRLWVVQYNQYPYPKGLKITGLDHHLRLQFDTVPLPPPTGIKGADKISVFEDVEGNGVYEHQFDAITGLNIATSVALGRGQIWVLSPPYLLAYPDPEGDGKPNGDPVVHLQGFGLEDTHAVANSLRWGPDGWLYGAQGSTTTANISSAVSKNVAFSGQAIWRYHPETKVFEIFAEGGGNTFNVEIDAKGRIFSGHNGIGRGPYYKQGGYYGKSWGKHGPLTNPYAFGYLPDIVFEGEKERFTHAFIRYEADALPERFQGNLVSLNPLLGYLIHSKIEPNGSNYKNIDQEKIVTTEDRWFRPLDIQTGPDGHIYFTDWYDSRLSHVDPRDTWDKTHGRLYRLRKKGGSVERTTFDLSQATAEELLSTLYHSNRWFRQKALQVIGDRKDKSMVEDLKAILFKETGQPALEALWAIHLIEGLSDPTVRMGLDHQDPYVRLWTIRLLGDAGKVSKYAQTALIEHSQSEPNIEVRCQWASSAKRWSPEVSLPILKNLLLAYNDVADPDIPMFLWWAIESQVQKNATKVVELFEEKRLWSAPIVEDYILHRLMQRLIMSESESDEAAAIQLFQQVPQAKYGDRLMQGLQEGLRGRSFSTLPKALLDLIRPYQIQGEGEYAMALRQGDTTHLTEVKSMVMNPSANLSVRSSYIKLFGEIKMEGIVSTLLEIIRRPVEAESKTIKILALNSLQSYDSEAIGAAVLQSYHRILREDPGVRMATLSLLISRSKWTLALLDYIENKLVIHPEDIPIELVQRMLLHKEESISKKVKKIWPAVESQGSLEKTQAIARWIEVVESASGDKVKGAKVFQRACGTCHTLFDEGGNLGPDLTGYDRQNISYLMMQIVDPNADIREGYVNYKVTLKDGRILSGFLTERSEKSITVQPFGGDEVQWSMEEVSELTPMPTSLMPEGILDPYSEEEVRDLFAYLMSQ